MASGDTLVETSDAERLRNTLRSLSNQAVVHEADARVELMRALSQAARREDAEAALAFATAYRSITALEI